MHGGGTLLVSRALRLASVALAALAVIVAGSRAADVWQPCRDCNVVLISLDTLRADHVSFLGYDRKTTPNLDALAARSIVFEDAISQSAWTRPVHTSMLTGLYPAEHGVVSQQDQVMLSRRLPRLATVLASHGYETAAFTGGVYLSRQYGYKQGFHLFRSNGRLLRDNGQQVRGWIMLNRDKPFFLFYHGYDCHSPYPS